MSDGECLKLLFCCCEETLYKGKQLMRLAYGVRSLVHYHHGMEYGSAQEDMVLEKELKGLHPDLQAAEKERLTGSGMGFRNLKAHQL